MISDSFLFLGTLCVSVGAGFFHPGAGLIVAGLCFFGLAVVTLPDPTPPTQTEE